MKTNPILKKFERKSLVRVVKVSVIVAVVFLLAFSIGTQLVRSQIEYERELERNPVTSYLRENYGVNSIEEYQAKLEQEALLNYTKTFEQHSSGLQDWFKEDYVGSTFGTSTYTPKQFQTEPLSFAGLTINPLSELSAISLSGIGLLSMTILPFVKNRKKFKQVLIFITVSLLIFGIGFFVGQIYAQSFTPPNVYIDSLPSTASYVISTDGTNVWATRYDGKIVYSGTDASTVIQSALNGLTSGRTWKERVVVKGEIVIYNTISIPSYTVLDLQGAKLILGNNVNKTMLSIGGHHIEILGGILYGNKTNNTSGDVIVSSGSYLDILVAGTKIFEVKGTGISFVYSSYVTITDCEVSGGYYGILLMNVDNALVEGNYIHDTDTASGIVVQESSSGGSNDIRIQGNYVYNAKTIGILARGSATYPSIRISIIGNIIINNKNDGICVAGVESSSIVGNISFQNTFDGISVQVAINSVLEGNVSYQNGGNGIYICDECANLLVQGNMLFNNDTDLSNDDGIRLSLFSSSVCPTGIKILNNVCTDTRPSGSKTQCYGINIFSGSDYNVVEGNYVDGNRTGSLYNGGAGSIIKNNIGYTTENSGTATIANNEWVSHGLAGTPTVVTTTVRTATYGTPAMPVIVGWINQNATKFQVSAYWTNGTAITADAINISWTAEYKP